MMMFLLCNATMVAFNAQSSESKTNKQETTKVTSSENKTDESSEPTDSSENTQSFEDGQDILKKDTLNRCAFLAF